MADMEEIKLSLDMGGEIGDLILTLLGKEFTCFGNCHDLKVIDVLHGYPHDGGLAAADGSKWWVYYHCTNPDCEYDTNWKKIIMSLDRYSTDKC